MTPAMPSVRRPDVPTRQPPAFPGPATPLSGGQRWVVGIGELKVSNRSDDTIVTHGLGSCVAVSIWDPTTRAGGLLHYLLPEARINAGRAAMQPEAFADTGIPRLVGAALALGLDCTRARVKLVGGAEIVGLANASLNIGRRNALAAKRIVWRAGLFVAGEVLGGTDARTVTMRMSDGVLIVRAGGVDQSL